MESKKFKNTLEIYELFSKCCEFFVFIENDQFICGECDKVCEVEGDAKVEDYIKEEVC